MSRYQRPKIEGGILFFTVVLADRSSALVVKHIERLRQVYRAVQARLPFDEAWIYHSGLRLAVQQFPSLREQRFASGRLGWRSGRDRGSLRGVIDPSGQPRVQNRPEPVPSSGASQGDFAHPTQHQRPCQRRTDNAMADDADGGIVNGDRGVLDRNLDGALDDRGIRRSIKLLSHSYSWMPTPEASPAARA
jgi:hypothetical protein